MKTVFFFLIFFVFSDIAISQLFDDNYYLLSDFGLYGQHAEDIDLDGDIDIIGHSLNGSISIILNEGNGSFTDQLMTGNSNHTWATTLLDVNNDGFKDIVVSGSYSVSDDNDDSLLEWYENLGSGEFAESQIIDDGLQFGVVINSGDIDGDGDRDLLASIGHSVLYENLNDGIFGEIQILKECSEQNCEVAELTAEDIDQDGDADILYQSNYNYVGYFENLGEAVFSEDLTINSFDSGVKVIAFADLDGDNLKDVIAENENTETLQWYKSLGDGTFSSEFVIQYDADIEFNDFLFDSNVELKDLNQDGQLDLVYGGTNILIFIKNEFGELEFLNKICTNNNINRIRLADIDQDGDFDIISTGSNNVVCYENLLGEGCTDPSSCLFDPEAWIDNGTCCQGSCGCTDPIAENYLTSAVCENGSCEYIEGCSNVLAINYNPNVTLDNGACQFKITGTVFYDENEDGIMDGLEYGLPFQTVIVEAIGQTYITNDQGEFIANIGSEQFAEFELIENPVFPYNTTPNPASFNASTAESTNIMFGISNEEPDFTICIDLYPSGNEFLCNDYSTHNICYRNMGNVPIDGIIELEYDELFQGHQEITEIDSVNGNTVYMSFENLLPGEMFFYDIELLTPTVDHIGESLSSTARAYGYYEGVEVAFGEVQLMMAITCAYDPNDKQAFPLGYTDEHWLLPETEQEFLVRFQNTGNAPAQDVRIQDTIDVNYDLSTFRMVANSHSVMTTINEETRVIDFYFQNIQLPDSVNNEPDSHGLVSYAITPHTGLDVGTELNNTAFIYFDNNEAIVTNTTWTTIHECGGEAEFDVSATEVCLGEEITFASSYDQVESLQWNIDAVFESSDSEITKTFDGASEYTVQLVAENPLCEESTMELVTVHENPSADFELSNSNVCLGDSVNLIASAEGLQSYEWSINSIISGEEISLTPELNESGIYEIALSTESENCSNSSVQSITVHENPTAEITEDGAILTATDGATYFWYLDGELIPNADTQTYEAAEDGSYSVEVTNENGCSTHSEQVMIVNIKEQDSPIVILYPNPMTEVAFIEFKDSSIRTIKLLGASGKEVRVWNSVATQKLEIQKQDLAAGSYVLQVYEGNEISSIKLVVE